MNRQQRRAAQRAAGGRRSPLRILIVGETDHIRFTLQPDQLDDTYAALPPHLRDDIKRASSTTWSG